MYEASQKEVNVHVMREIFKYAHLVSGSEIKTRFNSIDISVTPEDIAEALEISMNEGGRYSKNWMTQCNDSNCIWKESKTPRVAKIKYLVEECRFNHAVISKIILPKGG